MAILQQIHQAFALAFADFDQWVVSSSQSELIVDDSSRGSVFEPMGSAQGFMVENPVNRPFELIQIDGRLLPPQRGGQCDCAFIYDDSINLVEFKVNTTTINNAKKHYLKAEKQLKNTLKRFMTAGVDVLTLAADAGAHICFNNTFPRRRASEMNRAMRFAVATGGVGLSFDGRKRI